MEFTVSKSDLVRELGLSQGVVEKKTTIPILSNVLLEADGDRIMLTATDLELGIRCSCPARVKKEGAGTVPARKLLEFVRLLPEGDVTMKFLENHWASITSGRSRTRIAGMSGESFPALPQMLQIHALVPHFLNGKSRQFIFAQHAGVSAFGAQAGSGDKSDSGKSAALPFGAEHARFAVRGRVRFNVD